MTNWRENSKRKNATPPYLLALEVSDHRLLQSSNELLLLRGTDLALELNNGVKPGLDQVHRVVLHLPRGDFDLHVCNSLCARKTQQSGEKQTTLA
jgi:hypothetical protein